MESDENLERLHRDKLKELAPVIAILALLMIIGLVGNVSIFIFYWRQPKRSSTTFFIMVLAVTDFFVCCVMGLEIADVINTYVFDNDVACKLYIYCNHIAAVASGFVLVIIAIDRHRKLCHPLKPQLTLKHAKIVTIVCLTVALVTSVPVVFMFGTSPVNVTYTYNTSYPIKGSDCGTIPENEKFKEIFHYVYLFGFSICTIILVVHYTLIGRVIYRYHKNHQHFKRDIRQVVAQDQNSTSSAGRTSENVLSSVDKLDTSVQSVNSSSQTLKRGMNASEDNTTDIDCKDDNDPGHVSNLTTLSSQDRASSSSNNSSDTLNRDARNSDTLTNQKTSGKKAATKKYKKTVAAMKVTIMLFIMTVVFIVSFVPYQIVSSLGHGVYKETVGFELAYRSYLMNSIFNPFIFGLFNADFRRSFSDVLRSMLRKVRTILICTAKSETANIPEINNFNNI